MQSCLHHPHAMPTMMTWCSYNANTMMSCHFIPTWHELNAMLVTSWWCGSHHMQTLQHHNGHAHHMCKMGALNYLNGLTGMPANSNLGYVHT